MYASCPGVSFGAPLLFKKDGAADKLYDLGAPTANSDANKARPALENATYNTVAAPNMYLDTAPNPDNVRPL